MSGVFNPPNLPIGTVVPYAGASAPAGWLLCYGQNVSRTTYATLFGVLSTTFGSGDGSTTFGLPDLRGRAPFGKDDMGGSAANRVTNATSGITATNLGAAGGDERLHAHTHTELGLVGGSGAAGGSTFTQVSQNTGTAGAGSSQNMPPALVLNMIIYAGV